MKKDDTIRKKLHNLVDNADSKMLQALDNILGASAIPDWEDNEEFVEELKQLKPGESPQPAIENFLPAALIALQPAVKIAISIIVRDKVIGFLPKPLTGLVKK